MNRVTGKSYNDGITPAVGFAYYPSSTAAAIEPNLPNSGGWWQAYSHDAYGNRAVPPGYDVPNPDQTPAALTEFTLNRWKRGAGDSYDSSGNQTGVATRANTGVSANVFTYDGENRMVTSNVASMGHVTYSYDGEGRRVQKSCACGGSTCSTVFVYDAMGQLAAEYSTAPNPLVGTTEYLTADSLGSTRLVTDGSGAVTQCYDYLPFGEEIRQGVNGRGSCYPPTGVYPHAADATSMKFTGKERDVETGLDYFGARYFSGAQGRFTSSDPLMASASISNPQKWNRYSYGLNNPLRFTDPTGMYTCEGEKDQCKQFEKTLREIRKSKDKDARRGANEYGQANTDNGIVVTFADKLQDRGGQVERIDTGIRVDPSNPSKFQARALVTIQSDNISNQETVAHEGSHVADRQEFVDSISMTGEMDQSLNITKMSSEIRAYELSIRYANSGNKTINFGPCGPMEECKFSPMMLPVERDRLIRQLLTDPRNGYTNLDRALYPEFLKPQQ